MRRRWLWISAVMMLAGACASCGKGADEKGTGVAEEQLTAGEEAEKGGAGGDKQPEGESGSGRDAGEPKEAEGAGRGPQEAGENGEDNGNVGGAGRGPQEAGENGKEDGEAGETEEADRGVFACGTWDGLTFTNSWLNVVLTFPQGSKVFSAEEMRKLVGESDEILINGGDLEAMRQKLPQALNVYDFMATMPDGRSSIQLAYLNAEKTAPGQKLSAADCLEQMARELSVIGDMGYEIHELEKRELGGQVFDTFSASLMGGALYQEYYGIRAGDYVAIMTVSYEENGRSAVEELVNGIRAVR